MDNQWNEFIDRMVCLVYEDGDNHFSKKMGILKSITDTHLILDMCGNPVAINLTKVLRVEIYNKTSWRKDG